MVRNFGRLGTVYLVSEQQDFEAQLQSVPHVQVFPSVHPQPCVHLQLSPQLQAFLVEQQDCDLLQHRLQQFAHRWKAITPTATAPKTQQAFVVWHEPEAWGHTFSGAVPDISRKWRSATQSEDSLCEGVPGITIISLANHVMFRKSWG
jgi:hypothetical protein